ncbi:hypothetical protein SAMN04488029_0155 [Reichenbachiella faecimaris]|uniref:Uncharacterized protein n=1 Tax=Reichenbachiella faecimaris TaxID=692418 RepID=A0A1W2G570_REIFA|nr:hypothetical protein [Reichenbachiella faecimaris]SMD31817.1 hypothetical protein SAMN04488029_0155 [Reichenbachiella faecimaris]
MNKIKVAVLGVIISLLSLVINWTYIRPTNDRKLYVKENIDSLNYRSNLAREMQRASLENSYRSFLLQIKLQEFEPKTPREKSLHALIQSQYELIYIASVTDAILGKAGYPINKNDSTIWLHLEKISDIKTRNSIPLKREDYKYLDSIRIVYSNQFREFAKNRAESKASLEKELFELNRDSALARNFSITFQVLGLIIILLKDIKN